MKGYTKVSAKISEEERKELKKQEAQVRASFFKQKYK